jgi:hypothetical protein
MLQTVIKMMFLMCQKNVISGQWRIARSKLERDVMTENYFRCQEEKKNFLTFELRRIFRNKTKTSIKVFNLIKEI